MADQKVLAWGVLCGSGRLQEHAGNGMWPLARTKNYAQNKASACDTYYPNCGPHSVVPLGVVERAE